MSARWLLLAAPVVGAAACIFPDVSLDGETGTGGTTSSSTTDTSTSVLSSSAGDVVTTSSSSSSSTTSSSDGGGGSGDGGGTTSGDGGGGQGGGTTSTAAGGDGTCPAGPFGGCPYEEGAPSGAGGAGGAGGATSVLDQDCDGDGDPNGDDCQPCEPLAHHPVGDEEIEFEEDPYQTLDGRNSWDYDCMNGETKDFVFSSSECPQNLTGTCTYDQHYTVAAACGVLTDYVTCSQNIGDCPVAVSAQKRVACR